MEVDEENYITRYVSGQSNWWIAHVKGFGDLATR
jgi:hypothetical protein